MTVERPVISSVAYKVKGLDGVRPPNFIVQQAMHFMEGIFITKLTLEGSENFEDIRRLISEGKPVVIIANHKSNVDGPVIDAGFSREAQDLAPRLVYLFGTRLEHRRLTRLLGKGVPTILVWPPTEPTKTEEEEKVKRDMLNNSLNTWKAVLRNGFIPVLFPEGGRSRDEGMRRAFGQVAAYVKDTHVVPVAIQRTEKILRIGQIIPNRGEVEVNVGRPVDVKAIEESLSKDLTPKEAKQELVDTLMYAIARLLEPRYRGFYHEI